MMFLSAEIRVLHRIALVLIFTLLSFGLSQKAHADYGELMIRIGCHTKTQTVEIQPFLAVMDNRSGVELFKYRNMVFESSATKHVQSFGEDTYYYYYTSYGINYLDTPEERERAYKIYATPIKHTCVFGARAINIMITKSKEEKYYDAPLLLVDDTTPTQNLHFSINLAKDIQGFEPFDYDHTIDYVLQSSAYGIWQQCVHGINKVGDSPGASLKNVCLTLNQSGADGVQQFIKP